jgi:hypothetical protein
MNASLGLEKSVSIWTADGKRGVFDSRFFTWERVHEFDFETLVLRPTLIHTKKHLSPILGLGAARACVDRKNCVLGIGFFGEHFLELGFFEFSKELIHERRDLVQDGLVFFFLSELKKSDSIVVAPLKVVEEIDFRLKARLFSRQRAGFSIVLPKLWLTGEIGQLQYPASLCS